MWNCLIGIRAAVNHAAISGLLDTFDLRYTCRHRTHRTQECCIAGGGIGKSRDVFSRHYQHVYRSLGLRIAEGNRILILVHNIRRDLAQNNLAKQAISHQPV